ncbi:MAG: bifunctional 4-hydroxy-3-methylbut-2-enyl diphosphate reductase/30S ribosomal protein S1 [Oscillospiraceae bacterium]|nr:bifunctional 4-hydroxy-3-methylbut-2-enyl diphosphate reductase/30S ribosomal protein S1 [Oscillospiraceae bacterium]
MEVILARSAGFCFGVARAVRMAEELAASGRRAKMLGHIIHNDYEIARLAGLGLAVISSPQEAEEGDCVLLRAHGESRAAHEALASRGTQVVDATCPKVARVQQIVREAEAEGRHPVMIGDPRHPEVLGVKGWCSGLEVFSGPAEVLSWAQTLANSTELPIAVVAQTTLRREIWESSLKILKKQCTNLKIFDTICNATHTRQSEAALLAAKVDAMVVVGDPKSANTKHLTEICRLHCSRVFQIECADELPWKGLSDSAVVGLTAGASTPASIIKEVIKTMSEEKIQGEGMENFEELVEQYTNTLNTGDKVTGVVTAITPTEVHVDMGCKQAGYIPVDQLTDDPTMKPEDVVKVGDQVELFVIRVNDVEGYATLSKKKVDAVKVWENIEEACNSKEIMEGIITEENKGGVVASVKGVRVFIPASQSGLPRGAEMSALVKQKVQLRVTEVNRARRRVVGSIKVVQQEARQAAAEEVWANIEAGKHYTGTVKSMTSYGVFVDIGGVDGMVHITDLSWSRIKHPSEVVAIGDTLEVYVISYDPERRKISLGVKDRSTNPWQVFLDTYKVGDVANVRIVKLMTFGAFAEVVPGVDGLIHISQIADRRIEKPEDVLSEGQTVDAKITAVDEERQKISLSIRALLAPTPAPAEEE